MGDPIFLGIGSASVEIQRPAPPVVVSSLPPPGPVVSAAPPVLPVLQADLPGQAPVSATVVPVPGPQGSAADLTEADLERVIAEATEVTAEVLAGALVDHINSPAPHQAYDDLPSLTLIFENGIV